MVSKFQTQIFVCVLMLVHFLCFHLSLSLVKRCGHFDLVFDVPCGYESTFCHGPQSLDPWILDDDHNRSTVGCDLMDQVACCSLIVMD